MPDYVDVSVGWALWGKPAGTREDYSVQAYSHAPFTRADYAKILTHFTPGTATVGQGGPGALPWVTLSYVGIGDDLHLGIGIEEPTDDVDGVGRPITQTRYFCVPYQALAGSAVSYCDLYQKVAEITLPARGGDLIPLRLPRSD